MKYIDADKLRAKIEQRLKDYWEICFHDEKAYNANVRELKELLTLITSLQQERPEFKVGDIIHKIGENTVFPMTIEGIDDGYYVCVAEHTQAFINIKFQDNYELVEQEQPKVDLEKEINRYCGTRDIRPVPDFMDAVARHFAEWGATHLNARNEK